MPYLHLKGQANNNHEKMRPENHLPENQVYGEEKVISEDVQGQARQGSRFCNQVHCNENEVPLSRGRHGFQDSDSPERVPV